MKKKYRIRPGSIAWWAKDIVAGVLFAGTLCMIGMFMYMIVL